MTDQTSAAIQPKDVAKPKGVWTPVVVTKPGRMVFVSGFTSRDENGNVVGVGDIRAQTRQVCENLKKAMKAAGGELSDIVAVTVFVRDITQFDDIHAVRREYFPDKPPTSTMVEISRLVDERSLIEINAIAVLP
jgi:enamine deaminase RidA (YjgF/YER057c/UK114 family)